MARRRISTSQLRSKLRQAESKIRQAQSKIKREARKAEQDLKRAVSRHNQAARSHNQRVRANQARLKRELARLNSRPATPRYSSLRVSVRTVHEAYIRYEQEVGAEAADSRHAILLDLAEREDANTVAVMNALLDDDEDEQLDSEELRATGICEELSAIAPELDERWRGAVFALNGENPDAARHFCTSAREIFTRVLDLKARDEEVTSEFPACEKTQTGKPTRKWKIHYILKKKGLGLDSLEEFVEQNIANILELFGIFNSGTHGPAGRYDLRKLLAIKSRVEDGLDFMASIVS